MQKKGREKVVLGTRGWVGGIIRRSRSQQSAFDILCCLWRGFDWTRGPDGGVGAILQGEIVVAFLPYQAPSSSANLLWVQCISGQLRWVIGLFLGTAEATANPLAWAGTSPNRGVGSGDIGLARTGAARLHFAIFTTFISLHIMTQGETKDRPKHDATI
ncbi:hypothetical protein CIB48_g7297 [Xylaria polymorpha]|nr:hypothetical protein CIB48_g7297 [Xylaria polymorpha]